ncbi:MAG: hypothetical protein IJ035_04570 [Oscillospiraceae bacterium]|nr:hypothetical protein [Oscillospiraceae bacterium]
MKKSRIISAIAAAAVAATTFVSMAIPASAADTYNAYIGVQTQNFTFRNAWNEGTYGKGITADDGTVWFDQLTGWDGPTALDKGGDFTDVQITGDGTYKVGVTNFDFGSDEYLNLLFVSTDIPADSGVTISDVKVIMDGQTKYTFDEAFLSPDETAYLQPMAINIWNEDLGGQDGLFGYVMPTSSVEIEFTVSNFPAGGAADTTEEAPADTTTTAPTTGNVPAAVMLSVMAVAATAAVVSKKRN